jgi:hypothetical protein
MTNGTAAEEKTPHHSHKPGNDQDIHTEKPALVNE